MRIQNIGFLYAFSYLHVIILCAHSFPPPSAPTPTPCIPCLPLACPLSPPRWSPTLHHVICIWCPFLDALEFGCECLWNSLLWKMAWRENGWHIHTNAWSHELVHKLALWVCRIKPRKEKTALGKTLMTSSSWGRLSSFACTQCSRGQQGTPGHFLQPWRLGKPKSWLRSRED